MAYAFRNQTVIAEIAEVEVNRTSGRVWVKRLVCGHDCGLFINPEALRHTVECAMLHALSRALYEEVKFDTERVTSVNWNSYPILTHTDTPAKIDVVLVNGDPHPDRPDLPQYGAGEAACKPMIAAVANAIFDATGIRMRRVPFRPDRVLAVRGRGAAVVLAVAGPEVVGSLPGELAAQPAVLLAGAAQGVLIALFGGVSHGRRRINRGGQAQR